MKKSVIILFSVLFIAVAAKPQFKDYKIDGGYFSCQVPVDWKLERNPKEDEDYKIYEIKLLSDSRAWIYVSYYSAQSTDFKDYKDYIDKNTKDGLGRKNSDIGKYSDAKVLKLNNFSGFEILRELKEFSSLSSKSSDSYWVKERIVVVPAKAGFYVLSISAKKKDFEKKHYFFKKVLSSFSPKS